jgi:hypothetical protein
VKVRSRNLVIAGVVAGLALAVAPAAAPLAVPGQVVNDAATLDVARPKPVSFAVAAAPPSASDIRDRAGVVSRSEVRVAPKPKPKPTVEAPAPVKPSAAPKPKPVSKPAPPAPKPPSTGSWASTADVWAKWPAWVQTFALCVAKHESWHAGLWTAQNPYSTASGFAQWLDGTWRSHSLAAGLGGYSRAMYAPPRIQAAVFARAVTKFGPSAWSGTNCGYGT